MIFSEIVEKTSLNKSTVHRLLAIGVEEKLVRYEDSNKTYILGHLVFDLVRNAYKGYDIQAVALDEMLGLLDQFDVNVTLGVPSGLEVSYLRVLESRYSMSGIQRPGMRDPIHCSASGKVLMAYHPDKMVDSMLAGYDFRKFTDRTVTNIDEFKAELEFVRKNGFGINDREEYDHFLGISAPIFNYLGEAIAVVNLWSVYPRHTIDDIISWSDALKSSTAKIIETIGGTSPDMNIAK